jgi:hypothetical protein
MEQVRLGASPAASATECRHRLGQVLFEQDSRHALRARAGNQESCRDPLADNFAVEAVERAVDTQRFPHPRKQAIADAPRHRFLYQTFRSLPLPVRLRRHSDTLAQSLFRRSASTLLELIFFSCRNSFAAIFGCMCRKYNFRFYTPSVSQFYEERMPTKSFQTSLRARLPVAASGRNSPPGGQLQTPAGGAK